MLEEFFKSDLAASFEEVLDVEIDKTGSLHFQGCLKSKGLPGGRSRKAEQLTIRETLERSWGRWCCFNDASALPRLDYSVWRDAVSVFKTHKILESGSVVGARPLDSLQMIVKRADPKTPPALLSAAKELLEIGTRRFDRWSSSSHGAEFLDIIATLNMTTSNFHDLLFLEDVRDAPTSMLDYIARRRSEGMYSAKHAKMLLDLHESKDRKDGFLLVRTIKTSGVGPARDATVMSERYRIGEDLYKLPRHLRGLITGPRSGKLAAKTAIILPGDNAKIIETAAVLLKEGYESPAMALKAARKLEQ